MIHQVGHDPDTPGLTRRGEQLIARSADHADGKLWLLAHLASAPTLDDARRAAMYGERGRLHAQSDRYDDALADFNRAIELGPEDAEALAGRGFTNWSMGRYDDARADLQGSLNIKPLVGLEQWIRDRM